MEVVVCKAVSGEMVGIELPDLHEALRNQAVLVFGLGLPEILEMKKQYDLRGGPRPATRESIEKVFELKENGE